MNLRLHIHVMLRLLAMVILLAGPLSLRAQDSLGGYDDEEVADSMYSKIDEYGSGVSGILRDSPVLRFVPDTTVDRLKKQPEFAYANDPAYWRKSEKRRDYSTLQKLLAFFQRPMVQFVLYLILGLIVAYIFYQVVIVNNLFIFSRKSKKITAVNADQEEAMADDLEKKITSAIAGSDFRQAVRLLYLRTLRELNDKHLIRFHARSTNEDYLRQMNQNPLAARFVVLTNVYDYVWYGGYLPTTDQFETIHRYFKEFKPA